MPKVTVNNAPGAVPPLPFFSQAVISNNTVYVSGSVGCDNDHNIVGGIHQQTRAALDNMKAVLEGAGSDLDHVLKVNVYLSNIARDFEAFNEIYLEYFDNPERRPARTLIGVAALPLGAFVEAECIAELARND
ncbi:Endoribonuclease L-PSP [Chiua virens]|nr:Endoribonuclease L-PSP [Chiua virens]